MYKLVSREKLKRVKRTLSEKATEKEILVEYDRIGGLIEEITKKGSRLVATGSFYDLEEGKGRKKPKLTYK